MNPAIEARNHLQGEYAQSQARIQKMLGANQLALVTPPLERELKRAQHIAHLIDLSLDELQVPDEL